ncbi:MAG: hypothetical protein Q9159_006562 [Coniocarpon cinnabarinum]
MSAAYRPGSFSTTYQLQPTLPRLTRLGAPTDTHFADADAFPKSAPPEPHHYASSSASSFPALHSGAIPNARPSLPALDTNQLPPLPLPPFLPGFVAGTKTGKSSTPSTYSSTSSSLSRRRSRSYSAESDAETPPSSRSSASVQSGYGTKPQGRWGANTPAPSATPAVHMTPQPGQMSRKASTASEWSWAPSVYQPQTQLQPRHFVQQKPRSSTAPVQRPAGPEQAASQYSMPGTALNSPPTFVTPHTAPNSPPQFTSPSLANSPPQSLTPQVPQSSRTPSRFATPHTAPSSPPFGVTYNPMFASPPEYERTYRSSSEPQAPSFRSARDPSPQSSIRRTQSPLSYLPEQAYAPPPLRTSKSVASLRQSRSTTSSFTASRPTTPFSVPSRPRHAHKTSSVYSRIPDSINDAFTSDEPLPGAFPETPAELASTPVCTPLPPSRPMSPTELPMSDSEIGSVWSHACLLYHNGKVADAVTMLHQVHQRPGAEQLTMARLNINIGIMSESLSTSRNAAGVAPAQTTQLMIEAFQAAVKHSPDGPEGALATFLLGCALYDNQDFDKAAACFDMCEAIFGGEQDVMNYRMSSNDEGFIPGHRPSALEGGERIDLRARMGMHYTLHLTMVRENYHVAQERSRIPAYLGTNRGLHRIPSGLLIEEPFPRESQTLSPLSEFDEESDEDETIEDTESEFDAAMRTVTESLAPSGAGSGMELPDIRLDLGSPGPAHPKHLPKPSMPRRRSTKKLDRQELERRREARRTRILIKLGDLRLMKPLPPLPHERQAYEKKQGHAHGHGHHHHGHGHGHGKRQMSRAPTPDIPPVPKLPKVPPLPVAKVMGGMAFV